MIKVVDNLLDEGFLKFLQTHIVSNLRFGLHWSFESIKKNGLATDDIQYDPIIRYVGRNIEETELINPTKLLRAYVNLAPTGDQYGGDYHTDDGEITALYYPFPWDSSWGGATEFQNHDDVEYVCNRLVLFDSSMYHRGAAHTCPHFWRATIAFKINGEWTYK